MAGNQQLKESRVVKVDSEESWDLFFSQATNQGCPVVVHFTAAWCIPSVAMTAKIIDGYNTLSVWSFPRLNSSWASSIRGSHCLYMKLETQLIEVCGLYQEVASKMEIKAMPTFLLMREGAQVDKLVGANPDEIRKRTEAFIRSSRSHKMT
ncbi:Thioredoxin-like protein CXXS1 [Vitis vinifera]|uniref:Thioredoxin-like protein CXXS1 n=1 Tax=Vitis vinifera TaxID=29760 RepID=A0A438DPJ0_VITVI|nr:Thioredoxin-like protein CXXS1 [Vitis vinifera]